MVNIPPTPDQDGVILRPMLWAIGLLLHISTAGAQVTPAPSFEAISDSRIRSAAVTTIYQDRKGLIWIGAQSGLYRYDGYEVLSSADLDPNASWLEGEYIYSFMEDLSGRLWIFGREHTALWDPASRQILQRNWLEDRNIRFGTQRPDSSFWFAGLEGLVHHNPTGSDTTFYGYFGDRPDAPVIEYLTRPYIEEDRIIWIGTDKGVKRFSIERKEFEDVPFDGLTGDGPFVGALFLNPEDGSLWAGALDSGLFRKARHEYAFSPSVEMLPEVNGDLKYIVSGLFDENGLLWLGTLRQGMYVFSRELERMIQHYRNDVIEPVPPFSNLVSAIFQDRRGLMWVGTIDGLFKQHTLQQIPVNTTVEGIPFDLEDRPVKATFTSSDGTLWAGLIGGGLRRIDQATGITISYPDLDGSNVHAIDEDGEGVVWVAASTGLFSVHRSGKDLKRWKLALAGTYGTDDYELRHVLVDSHDEIWISTIRQGIVRLDTARLQVEVLQEGGPDSGLVSNDFWFTFEDREGFYWFGSESSGMTRYDPKTAEFVSLRHRPGDSTSLSSDRIVIAAEDAGGTLWIGTRNGLNRYDRATQTFRRYLDGLPNKQVVCIAPQEDGTLWLATRDGIAHLDPVTGGIESFDEHDGLPATAFYFNACHQDESGRIFFGSGEGLFYLRPEDLLQPMPPAVVSITGYELFDTQYALPTESGTLELKHDQNFITLFFSTTDYLALEKNRFRYKLEGVDEQWIDAGPQNFAPYTNLGPDNYTFMVQGANHRGTWSDVSRLSMIIYPPFWKTWWFTFLWMAVIAGSGYRLYRARVRYLLRVKEEENERRALQQQNVLLEKESRLKAEQTRTQIAKDLHDDLGSDLTRLVISMERRMQIEGLNHEIRSWITDWWQHTRRTARELSALSWVLDADRDRLPDLVNRMYREAEETLVGIQFHFHTDVIPDLPIDSNIRRDLYMIYRETLTNIVRHGKAEEVTITTRYVDDEISVLVQDDGQGFNENVLNVGNGLLNMRKRADRIGAKFSIVSSIGAGTKIEFRKKMA